MKKIITLALLLITALTAEAQEPTFFWPVPTPIKYNWLQADKFRLTPTDTSQLAASGNTGYLLYQSSDNTLYQSNGSWWKGVGTGITLQQYMDSLAAHAVTLLAPLYMPNDSMMSLDTSAGSPIGTKTYNASHYVNLTGTQTVSGAKTFSSTTQFLNSSTTVRYINTPSVGTRNTNSVELDFEPATPTPGIGAALTWRSFDASKNIVYAGAIGADLLNNTPGSLIGEIHISPAYHGSGVDNNSAGLNIISTGVDSADSHIKGGDLYIDRTPQSGNSDTDSLMVRGSTGKFMQISPSIFAKQTAVNDSIADVRHDVDSIYAKKTDVPTITSPLWDSPNNPLENPSGTAGTDLQFQLSSLPYTSTVSSSAFASSVDNILIRIRFTYIIAVPASATAHIGISIDGGAIQNVTGTLAEGERDGVIQIDLTNEVTNNQLRMSATNNGALQAFGDLTGVDLSQNLTIQVYYNQATVAPVGNEAALQPFTVEVEDLPTAN